MLRSFSTSRTDLKRLSLLLNAGIPLAKALDSIGLFSEVSEKVKAGSSLADSLDHIYPLSVRNIITVGESSGDLSGAVSRACGYLENSSKLRSRLLSSLIYPAFVMMLCGASIFILVAVLLPSFSGIFDSLGIKLPFISRAILSIGHYFPLILPVLALVTALSVKYIFNDFGLKLPLIGSFRRKVINASFFHSMSQYLNSGLSILAALDLSISAISSDLYKLKLGIVKSRVNEGAELGTALLSTQLFSEGDMSLISAGESSSSLAHVFTQLSRYHEDEIENGLKTFSSLIEPISTLATGLVVGIIVFAMFMPIIKLISVLGS